jgi:hypothetical protein
VSSGFSYNFSAKPKTSFLQAVYVNILVLFKLNSSVNPQKWLAFVKEAFDGVAGI